MTDPRPNILLITLDQWRADCLSAAGHACLATPNIDALAAEGVRFRNHFSVAAPCGPSRASLLTGLYLHNHRSVRNGVPLDRRHGNLALELARAGYQPRLFGFTDTTLDPRGRAADDPALSRAASMMDGFAEGLHLPGDAWPWIEWLAARGYPAPAMPRDVWLPAGGPRMRIDDAPTRYRAEESETAYLTDAVIAFLEQPPPQPWCVHLSYFRPHHPYIAPFPYNCRYDPADVPAPRRAASPAAEGAQHPWLAARLSRQRAGPAPVQDPHPMAGLDDGAVAQLRATYYGSIAECDAAIGRLLAALKRGGNDDRTLVVLTADHGDMLGDHWLWAADGYFDEAFAVPLIIRPPAGWASGPTGRHAGGAPRTVDAPTESVDLMPTILALAGIPLPRHLDGRSLLPLLQGTIPADWRDAVHWEFDFRDTQEPGLQRDLGLAADHANLAVIRDRDFKYVHFAGLPALLFDLRRDPHAFQDVAPLADYAPVLARYAQKLLSWRMGSDDRGLTGMAIGPGGVTLLDG